MKLFRASGFPVEQDHKEKHLQELNKEMDRLEAEMGKCNPENVKEFSKKLDAIHRDLTNKYPIVKRISMPKTEKAMMDFTKQYGAVAFCQEDGKLVAYIMDA